MKSLNHSNPSPVTDTLVGQSPWLPRPMARMKWWNAPIRAHWYACLRITVALVLLLDQIWTMLPNLELLYGDGSTGSPQLFNWFFQTPNLNWSILAGIGDIQALRLAMGFWIAATLGLLVGWNTRMCAVATWILAVSFTNLNVYAINAGDHIRGMLLLYLMLTPCGAVWSIDSRLAIERKRSLNKVVHPWALRLILIHFAFMYCSSGWCKLSGHSWPAGESLYYVVNDLSVTRFSAHQFGAPYWVMQLSTWGVLFWEATFPLWLFSRRTRLLALLIGVTMHTGIFVTMELGCFPLYLLAAYVPLVGETWTSRKTTSASSNKSPISTLAKWFAKQNLAPTSPATNQAPA